MNTGIFIPFSTISKNALAYLNGVWITPSFQKAGMTYSMFFHDYYEVEFIISGKVQLQTPWGKKIILPPGSVYCTSPLHARELVYLEASEICNVSFDSNFVPDDIITLINKQYTPLIAQPDAETLNFIKMQLRQMSIEISEQRPMYKTVVSKLLQSIIIMISRLSPTDSDIDNSLIQKCLFIILNNYKDAVTLSDIAKTLGITPSYLGKLFKKNFKCSFNSYINAIKISHAKSMLALTDKNIKEIAQLSGFDSVEYFNYVFKNNTGMSPSNYKKSFKDIDMQIHEYLLKPQKTE